MKVLGHLFKNVTVKIYALLQASGLKAHVSVAGTPHRDWTGNSLDFGGKCKKRKFREQKSQSIESGKVHDEAKKVEDQVTEGPESKLRKAPGSHLHFRQIPLSLASGRSRELRPRQGGELLGYRAVL